MTDLAQFGFNHFVDPTPTPHWSIGDKLETAWVDVSFTKTENFSENYQKRHNVVQKNWYVVWGDKHKCFALFLDSISHIDWQAIVDINNSEIADELKVLLFELVIENIEPSDFTLEQLAREHSCIRTHDEWMKYSEKYRELYKINEITYNIAQIPMRDFIEYVIQNNEAHIKQVEKFHTEWKQSKKDKGK